MRINNKKSVILLDFMENIFSIIFEYVLRKKEENPVCGLLLNTVLQFKIAFKLCVSGFIC